MANFIQIKRWEILTTLVKKHPYISKKELIDRIEIDYEMPVTARTLERDLNKLATDFGVFISYDRHRKGYFVF